MSEYYKYRVRCTTDNKDEYWVLSTQDNAPTTCPTNTAHTIDNSQTAVVEEITDNAVQIKQEKVPTGGNFSTRMIKLEASPNSVTTGTIFWPHPITVLSTEFVSGNENEGDIINVYVGKDTTIGTVTTASVAPANAWVSQNYTEGDVVTYTAPIYGNRTYTCILNTVSNEIPTNTTYWRHGLRVNVSSTVLENCKVGGYIKLDDLTNSDDCGRIISVDKENSRIYLETNVTNTYSPSTPTYIKQSLRPMADLEIGKAWLNESGPTKITGGSLPADVVVTLEYENKHISDTKTVIFKIDFLY